MYIYLPARKLSGKTYILSLISYRERKLRFRHARLADLREGALLCGEEGTLKLLASALLELAGAQGKVRVSPLGAEGYLADLGYPQEVLERLKAKLR